MTTFLSRSAAAVDDGYETRTDIGQAVTLGGPSQPSGHDIAEAICEGREIVSISCAVDPAATGYRDARSFILFSWRTP